MKKKIGGKILRYGAIGIMATFLGCKPVDKVGYYANTARFYNAESQAGFVSKEQSFNIGIERKKNDRGNLETYVRLNDVKYEALYRKEGLVLGDAAYNWSNFSDGEKKDVIMKEIYNNKAKIGEMIDEKDCLYILENMPKETRENVMASAVGSMKEDEIMGILSRIDYGVLWDSIPREKKKELLIRNLKSSTRKSIEDIKMLLHGFMAGGYDVR